MALADDQIQKTIDGMFGNIAEKTMIQVPVLNSKNEDTGETKDQFALKGIGYYDVLTYVYAGMSLPKTKERFEELYKPGSLSKLNELDPNIYNETRNIMLDVQNSCQDFNDKSMANWLLITNQTIQYSKFALDQIGTPGQGGLKDEFATLLDPKYKGNEEDPVFQSALEVVVALLQELRDEANKKGKKVDELITAITKFHGNTLTNQDATGWLKRQYFDGPVTVARGNKEPKKDAKGNVQQPYSISLDAESERLRREVISATDEYNRNYDDWKKATVVAATAPTYIWIGPAGFIAGAVTMGVYTDRAIKAHAAYEENKQRAELADTDRKTLLAVIHNLSMITTQMTGIYDKMKPAIEALQNIKDMFNEQAINFGLAVSNLESAENRAKSGWALRSNYLQKRLNDAADNYRAIDKLAREFLASMDITAVAASSSSPPPKTR